MGVVVGASAACLDVSLVVLGAPNAEVEFCLSACSLAAGAEDGRPKVKAGLGASTSFSEATVEVGALKEGAGLGPSADLLPANENEDVLAGVAFAALGTVNENDTGLELSFNFAGPADPFKTPFAWLAGEGADCDPKVDAGMDSEEFASKPKLNGAGAGFGIEIPDVALDFVPKKSGTPDDVAGLACSDVGEEAGLPIPKPRVFIGPSDTESPRPTNRGFWDLLLMEVASLADVRRKKPSEVG